MQTGLKFRKYISILLLAVLMVCAVFAAAPKAYADPEDGEGADVPDVVSEQPTQTAQPDLEEGAGIVVGGTSEENDGNIMDSLLRADRVWLRVFGKIVSRLVIVLGILIVCVVGICIYIMVTQTSRLSKQREQMQTRPARALGAGKTQVVPAAPASAAQPQAGVRQVTQFGDTLRIRRTVAQPQNARQGAANMQRPVAPQRPSRPQQSAGQPGVRRPQTQQVVRRDANGNPIPAQRPQQGARPTQQGARPAQQGARPTQQGARPTQQGARPAQQGARPTQQGARPAQQPIRQPQRPANAARPTQPARRPAQSSDPDNGQAK